MVYLLSDTPSPPSEPVTAFPFRECWWTVKAYNRYGASIHADPVRITAENVVAQTIENATTGQTYASIQTAINDAYAGDEIVVGPGVCRYLENLDFRGKGLTLRSIDPNDPEVMAHTIIQGDGRGPVVRLSRSHPASVLAGLTISGGTVGISCSDARPTIRSCVVENPDGIAIEYWHEQMPRLIDCTILGQMKEGGDLGLIAYWKLDETEGVTAFDSEGDYDATVMGLPAWQPTGGRIDGALELTGMTFIMGGSVMNPADGPFSVLAWIKGGQPGQGIITQQGGVDWLMADAAEGKLATELSRSLRSETVITDGDWHRIGVTWDGSACLLYVDDVLEAQSEEDGLANSTGRVIIGCQKTMAPGTYWTGLIDDVRIYNRAVIP
jgi:hypothetical protein